MTKSEVVAELAHGASGSGALFPHRSDHAGRDTEEVRQEFVVEHEKRRQLLESLKARLVSERLDVKTTSVDDEHEKCWSRAICC